VIQLTIQLKLACWHATPSTVDTPNCTGRQKRSTAGDTRCVDTLACYFPAELKIYVTVMHWYTGTRTPGTVDNANFIRVQVRLTVDLAQWTCIEGCGTSGVAAVQ